MKYWICAITASLVTLIAVLSFSLSPMFAEKPTFKWVTEEDFEMRLAGSSPEECVGQLLNLLKVNVKDRCGYGKLTISIYGNVVVYEDYCCLTYGTILGVILEYNFSEFCSDKILGNISAVILLRI